MWLILGAILHYVNIMTHVTLNTNLIEMSNFWAYVSFFSDFFFGILSCLVGHLLWDGRSEKTHKDAINIKSNTCVMQPSKMSLQSFSELYEIQIELMVPEILMKAIICCIWKVIQASFVIFLDHITYDHWSGNCLKYVMVFFHTKRQTKSYNNKRVFTDWILCQGIRFVIIDMDVYV